jgi:TRAP-type C4-dicarboxylate transport system substrate-binding protein
MHMKNLTATLAAAAVSAAGSMASAEKWDMPMAYPATNYHTENGVAFAQCVKDKTAGAIDIVVHPNGSLFSGSDIKRAVQTGQAPIGERLLSAHANENPIFGVDSIPFLATSFDDSDRLLAAAKPALTKALDAQNLVYVYSVPWPPQGLYFKKQVNSVKDMQGIKFRAYNAATARIAELAGMVPVQIEAAELSQALATGVAESFISSGSTGVDSKVWESLNHFYDVQAWLPRNTVFVNKDSFNALSEANQKAVMDCGAEAAKRGEDTAKKLSGQYLKTLAENGMSVLPPSPELKNELKGFGDTMTAEWIKAAGATGKEVIDAYEASK